MINDMSPSVFLILLFNTKTLLFCSLTFPLSRSFKLPYLAFPINLGDRPWLQNAG